MPEHHAPSGRPRPGGARRRLGAELRKIRTTAGRTQRDLHGPTGSGHASNVENGHTQPSWDFIEKYLLYGGDARQLRSLYELARAESDDHRTVQRRSSQPGSYTAHAAPRELDGLEYDDVRRHYAVLEREERYLYDADGVASSLTVESIVRATSTDVTLVCGTHSYDADPRPGLLSVTAERGCAVERVDSHSTGPIQVYFRLDRCLRPEDEPYRFVYTVTIDSPVRARPLVLGHPGAGTRRYTVEARFRAPSTPREIWWFATENELAALMPNANYRLRPVQDDTYRRSFDAIAPGWCYGFAWLW